jgi:hypothetical protein
MSLPDAVTGRASWNFGFVQLQETRERPSDGSARILEPRIVENLQTAQKSILSVPRRLRKQHRAGQMFLECSLRKTRASKSEEFTNA